MKMKVLVDYDPLSGNILMENGKVFYTESSMNLTEYSENKEVIEMLKLGASTDEIIKLKHNGVIK